MNKQFVEEWLYKLKNYWFNKDINNAVSLFKNTTFYQETPFIKPFTTLEEIMKNGNMLKMRISKILK